MHSSVGGLYCVKMNVVLYALSQLLCSFLGKIVINIQFYTAKMNIIHKLFIFTLSPLDNATLTDIIRLTKSAKIRKLV